MVRVVLCYDDKKILGNIESNLKKYEKESGIKIQINYFSSGINLLDKYNDEWDILFLEIEMKIMDGIMVAKKIRKMMKDIFIVFLSETKEYSFEGYSVQASNYFLKPIRYLDIKEQLDKIVPLIKSNNHIYIKSGNKNCKINKNEILYIETDKERRIIIHTIGESLVTHMTLKKIEVFLYKYFLRPHNSYLVNLKQVDKILDRDILMSNSKLIPLSRLKKKQFTKDWLLLLGES